MENNVMENGAVENKQPVAEKQSKKGMIIAVIVAMAFVIALLVIMLGNNYEAVLEDNVKLLNDYVSDAEQFEKLSDVADMYNSNKAFNEKLGIELVDADEQYEAAISILKEKYGDDYKITCEIIKSEKLNNVEREAVKEAFEKSMAEMVTLMEMVLKDTALYAIYFETDANIVKEAATDMVEAIDEFEAAKCTSAYKTEINCTIEGSKGSESIKYDIVFAKIDGKWKMLEKRNEIYDAISINPMDIITKIEN